MAGHDPIRLLEMALSYVDKEALISPPDSPPRKLADEIRQTIRESGPRTDFDPLRRQDPTHPFETPRT